MSTITKFIMISLFLFAGWNWGARYFMGNLPYLTLMACGGVSGAVMIGLILTGKNK